MDNINNNQMGYPVNSFGANMQRGNVNTAPIMYPYNNLSYDNYNMGRITPQNLSNQYLKCRPVASKQEAIACQIDLDGSLWVFTNIGNGEIYTKQINNDGTASFHTYVFTQQQNPYASGQYVTKDQFNKVIQALTAAITPMQEKLNANESNNRQNKSNVNTPKMF